MPMKSKLLHTLAFVGPLLASIVAGSSASATTVLSNGGVNFQAAGPTRYWHYDQDAGFCSSTRSTWCQPRNAQWTYSVRGTATVNNGTWTVPKALQTQIESRVYAFIPARNATTSVAPYSVNYMIVSPDNNNRFYPASSTNYVNQLRYYNAWAQLNTQSSYAWVDNVILFDNTSEAITSKISFDEIKTEN